jgi:hypothetical protein
MEPLKVPLLQGDSKIDASHADIFNEKGPCVTVDDIAAVYSPEELSGLSEEYVSPVRSYILEIQNYACYKCGDEVLDLSRVVIPDYKSCIIDEDGGKEFSPLAFNRLKEILEYNHTSDLIEVYQLVYEGLTTLGDIVYQLRNPRCVYEILSVTNDLKIMEQCYIQLLALYSESNPYVFKDKEHFITLLMMCHFYSLHRYELHTSDEDTAAYNEMLMRSIQQRYQMCIHDRDVESLKEMVEYLGEYEVDNHILNDMTALGKEMVQYVERTQVELKEWEVKWTELYYSPFAGLGAVKAIVSVTKKARGGHVRSKSV